MLEVDSILGTFGVLFVIQGIMLVIFGGTCKAIRISRCRSTFRHHAGANRILALGFALLIRPLALSGADAHALRHRIRAVRRQS